MPTGDALLRAHLKGSRSYCPHKPFETQKAFLSLDCLEALFGGAAGGGKSDALLMAALQYMHVPGYAAGLFRRTHTDLALPGAIMSRSHEWFAGTDAHWNGEMKTWTFPTGSKPSTLTFGYLDNDRDRFRYQSTEFQFLGFDEGTQFPELWYLYMLSRLRRLKGVAVPLRARLGSNPGGIGHKWVKKRFVDPDTALGAFVPSKLDDNPFIDAVAYLEALDRLDPTTRAQLRDGLWVQDTSGLVYSSFDRRLVVPVPADRTGWRHVLAFDFGNVNATAWGVLGWAKHSRIVHMLESEKRTDMIPSEVGELVRDDLSKRLKFDRIVGDVGGLGKGYAEEMRRRYGVPIEPAEKVNKLGFIKLINGAMARREFLICEGNEDYCVEMEELPWQDDDRVKEAPGVANHLCDMGLYGYRAALAWAEKDAPDAGPPVGSDEWQIAQANKERQKAIAAAAKRAGNWRWTPGTKMR